MTTASSLPFSTMEVPSAEDTMEMASPLPGNADDFEIDLDVMEDQDSNADRDMMGADDYPDGSLDIDLNHDGANDADMMDEPAEPTMVDADDQNDNVEMQYSAEETYEAEMEDGYDEDIDVPMPKPDEEVPAPAIVEDGNAQPVEVEVPAEAPAKTNDVAEKESEKPSFEFHAGSEKEQVAENIEVPHTEPAQDHPGADDVAQGTGSEQVHDTNKPEPAELQTVQPDVSKNDHTDLKELDDKERETAQVQPPVEETKDQEAEPIAKPDAAELAEQNPEADTDKHAGLHPVKVYYQDNEISLFPPREGDSSETYFLEDENLAYESFGKLFESCHEVLREHIGDNEVLVVDIDALNIQLTEDSLHLSKVTLSQIVNLYLHLCQNDHIEEPEALYLTLSTKLTIPAAVSDLLVAANEGKGLSEIYPWDDYEEAGPPSEEVHADDQYDYELHGEDHAELEKQQETVAHEVPEDLEKREEHAASEREAPVPAGPAEAEGVQAPEEHENPETFEAPHEVEEHAPEAPQQETVKHEDNLHHDCQQETSDQTELDVHGHDVHDGQDDQENENEDTSNDRGEDYVPTAEVNQDEYEEGEYEEGEYDLDGQEYDESQNQEYDHHSPNEYDSEEQKTESTATIAALPGTNVEDEQQDTGLPADVPQTEDGDQDEYQGIDGTEEQDYPEEEANVDAPNHAEYSEEFEDNGGDYGHNETKAEENAEESRDENPSEVHEPDHGDGNGEHLASKEEVAEEPFQDDSEDASHGQPEGGALDSAQDKHQDTSDVVDDLGIEDDLTESTVKNATDVNGETGHEDQDHVSSGEVFDETEHAPSANPQGGAVEDLKFDGDDEYLNLNFDDEPGQPEPIANDHVSTKRSREAEDDLELTETPTPDVKRTRSS